jgi:hypothetical protein
MIMKTIVLAILAALVVVIFATVRPGFSFEVPSRVPSKADSALAALVNSLDADMRSIEIGSWFVSRLRAQIMAKVDPVRCDAFLDLGGIADAVPGANALTKSEIVARLQRLVDVLFASCKGSTTKSELVRALDSFEDSAFHPRTGILLAMPGYSAKSPRPLPK